MDDEPVVLRALARLLEGHYDVTAVSSPEGALRQIAAAPWSAILTDVMMPKIDGVELAQRALTIRPELAGRIVLMSGGMPPQVSLGAFGFPALQKPFSVGQARALLDPLVRR